MVQVLVVDDVPSPAFTSVLPAARRRHAAARATWQRLEQARTRETVDALLAVLPPRTEVVHTTPRRSDAGRIIAEHAKQWHADVVVVGRDTRAWLSRTLLGAVHEQVLARAPCAVLVTPEEHGARRVPLGSRQTVRGGA
jgi:nucleotide-binding universal stress UspA family protein